MRVLLLLLATLVCHAADVVVLLDCSGSMAGFHSTGGIEGVVGALRRFHQEDQLSLCGFIDEQTVDMEATRPVRFGSVSLIGMAFERELARSHQPRTLYLITDNISTPAQDPSGLRRFFELLEHELRITSLTLLPMMVPFNGPRYDFHDRPLGDWEGNAGLLVYEIHLDELADSGRAKGAIETELPRYLPRGVRMDAIPIRPLPSSAVSLLLAPEERGRYDVVPGNPLRIRFRDAVFLPGHRDLVSITFKPRMNLKPFVLRDVKVKVRTGAGRHPVLLLPASNVRAAWTPTRIQDVRSGGHIQDIKLRLAIGPIIVKSWWDAIRDCLTLSSPVIDLPVQVEFSFPYNALKLRSDRAADFANDIPHFEDLVQEIYLEENTMGTTFIIELNSQQPPILFWSLLVIGALLLIGLVACVLMYLRRPAWILTDPDDEKRRIRPWLYANLSLSEIVLQLRGKEWRVQARPGYKVLEMERPTIPVSQAFTVEVVALDGDGADDGMKSTYRVEPEGGPEPVEPEPDDSGNGEL
jgi:hypothetical protein